MGGNDVGVAIMWVAAPLIKSVGRNLSKRGVLGASKVATDFVLGKNLKDSAMRRFGDEAAGLTGDVMHAVMPDVLKRRTRKWKTPRTKKNDKKEENDILSSSAYLTPFFESPRSLHSHTSPQNGNRECFHEGSGVGGHGVIGV